MNQQCLALTVSCAPSAQPLFPDETLFMDHGERLPAIFLSVCFSHYLVQRLCLWMPWRGAKGLSWRSQTSWLHEHIPLTMMSNTLPDHPSDEEKQEQNQPKNHKLNSFLQYMTCFQRTILMNLANKIKVIYMCG